jgi:hypothetical protein
MHPRPGTVRKNDTNAPVGEEGADRFRPSRWPRKTVLRALPVAFLLHNAEEAIGMRKFLPVDPGRLPGEIRPYVADVSHPTFLLALAVVTLVPFGVAGVADLARRGGWGTYTLLAFAAVFLLNVFSHVGSTVLFGGYTPGLATALMLHGPVLVGLVMGSGWLLRLG